MSQNMGIIIILLLPLVWGVVFLVRALMGGGFRSKDRAAQSGAMLSSQWHLKQQQSLFRGARKEEEEKELWAEDEWGKKQKPDSGHDYPVRGVKKTHVPEETETLFPTTKRPDNKQPKH